MSGASMPPEVEQARQLHRTLTEKVLDKACSDPQWKQLLIDNPEVAMQEADFPEAHQLFEASDEVEVEGHVGQAPTGGCQLQCVQFTVIWDYTNFGNW
jgi:hypothetical protein